MMQLIGLLFHAGTTLITMAITFALALLTLFVRLLPLVFAALVALVKALRKQRAASRPPKQDE